MKINSEMKMKIHNRFKMEVERDGEIIQEGFAENIVLDRIYTRLMSFSSFFTYIHVGGGTGILTPSRTTLFSPITNKAVTVDEKIKAYPISSVTKRVTFGTTEQNGQTFTEVGISESTNAINTHALIKDAEGNPLSVTKTDTDIITIYATIYFELIDDPNVDGKFNKRASFNTLIDYVIDGSSVAPSLWLGNFSGENTSNYMFWREDTHSLTRTSDSVNRVNTYSTRIDTGECNFDICEISLDNIFLIDLKNALSWSPYTLSDIMIGTGDGITTDFNIGRYDVSSLIAKVDGVQTVDFVLNNVLSQYSKIPVPMIAKNQALSFSPCFSNVPSSPESVDVVLEVDEKYSTTGLILETKIYSRGGGNSSSLFIDVSEDGGETFTRDATLRVYAGGWSSSSNTQTLNHTLTKEYTHVKFIGDRVGTGTNYYICFVNSIEPCTITFAEPPPEGAPITVSYTVPYIPKTEDYVIDLSLALHW